MINTPTPESTTSGQDGGAWIPKEGDWFIMKASYCGADNPKGCTSDNPCEECLAMCNRYVITAEHYGRDFFFGGGWCSRDGGRILNETYSFVLTTDLARVAPFKGISHISEAVHIPSPQDEELNKLRAEKAELVEALSSLYDEQNGPPLIKHEARWIKAMEAASALISKHAPAPETT